MKKWFGGLLAGLLFSLSAWAAVDINTATQSELEAVKGIGPAKAKAIVEHRQKSGPFKSVDDLPAAKK
ncbi:MAG: competence protein ComEA [bacterium]|nr:MAG: competence protein ComEA [bacterium]